HRADLLLRAGCGAGLDLADTWVALRDLSLVAGDARLQVLHRQHGKLYRDLWSHRRRHGPDALVLHLRAGHPHRRRGERRHRACVASWQGPGRESTWTEA